MALEPDLAPPDWEPHFVDYLYLSFTNATAFSPTDVMPLARWAKLTMAGPVGGVAAGGRAGDRPRGQHPAVTRPNPGRARTAILAAGPRLPAGSILACYSASKISPAQAGGHVGHYKSNLRDIEFNLFEVLSRQDLLGSESFPEIDEQTARGILAEVNRLATGPVAESFAEADRHPPVFDPATSSVRMPEAFKKSFQAFMDAEWFRLELPARARRHPAPRGRCTGPWPS